MDLIAARSLQCEVHPVGHIFSAHGRAEPLGDDVPAVIVDNRAEVKPSTSHHLDVGEVSLPKLVDCCRLVLELIGSF